MSKSTEEVLSNYVSESEVQNEQVTPVAPISKPAAAPTRQIADVPDYVKNMRRSQSQSENSERYSDNLGWQKIPVDTLPTGGLYYPEGTTIYIRSAQGKEIKHWSTLQDDNLSAMDDMLNYIMERCCKLKTANGELNGGSWKDIKDIDRFYLILSIRELTFPDSADELKIPVRENYEIPVVKEMIDFISIPPEIMKYYSETERCFVLKLKTGRTIRMYIPSIGINEWLKRYAMNKEQMQAGYDKDYFVYAPMLIDGYRQLSERAYNEKVIESETWSGQEWSLIAYVRDMIAEAVDPKLKFTDEDGTEKTTPLNIPGGVKSLFRSVSDPLSLLD